VDAEGARFENGEVIYAKGTREGMKACRQAQLSGITLPRKYGGLNCPMTIYTMAIEIVSKADASFMNIFGLQDDIAGTIYRFADDDIKERYLPRLCSGEVTSSMVLTEPDAGSDLQAVSLKALEKDGKWYLDGVKRFITNGCGEIALVLARSEEGTTDGRGLSLFLYERDSSMIIRRIEDKLGIHGSPTCELQFNRAPALLVGKRRMGLIKYVMSLMNEARIGVSAQAVGIAEAAYREAEKYANERIQFKTAIKNMMPVADMLTNMKVKIEAGRALLYETTRIVDLKDGYEELMEKFPEKKKDYRDKAKFYNTLAALFTPLCKAFTTEMANQVAYDGIQIHGGTGYMKDFHAERLYRDARITNIYEGTTQLQIVAAIGGVLKGAVFEWIDLFVNENEIPQSNLYMKDLQLMKDSLESLISLVKEKKDPDFQSFHARRLVEMSTLLIIGYLLLNDSLFSERKKDILRFFIDCYTPEFKKSESLINKGLYVFFEKKDIILNGKN